MPELTEMPLDRFFTYVWYRLMEGRDEQEVAKLRAQLWRPPPGMDQAKATADKRSPWNPQNETAALGALMSQLGGNQPTG